MALQRTEGCFWRNVKHLPPHSCVPSLVSFSISIESEQKAGSEKKKSRKKKKTRKRKKQHLVSFIWNLSTFPYMERQCGGTWLSHCNCRPTYWFKCNLKSSETFAEQHFLRLATGSGDSHVSYSWLLLVALHWSVGVIEVSCYYTSQDWNPIKSLLCIIIYENTFLSFMLDSVHLGMWWNFNIAAVRCVLTSRAAKRGLRTSNAPKDLRFFLPFPSNILEKKMNLMEPVSLCDLW